MGKYYDTIQAKLDEIMKEYDVELGSSTAEYDEIHTSGKEPPAEEEMPTPALGPDNTCHLVPATDIGAAVQEQQEVTGEQIEQPVKKRRRFDIGGFLFYGVLIGIVLAVYFFGDKGGNQPRTLFGYSIYTVLTGSMRSEIPEGSLVITKYTIPDQIKVGDDITYLREDFSTITHRVIEIHENYNDSGVRGFRTKGIDNPMADTKIVHPDNILGVVVFHVPVTGAFFDYVKQKPLLIVLTGVILIALVYTIGYLRRNRKKRPKKEKPTMV